MTAPPLPQEGPEEAAFAAVAAMIRAAPWGAVAAAHAALMVTVHGVSLLRRAA